MVTYALVMVLAATDQPCRSDQGSPLEVRQVLERIAATLAPEVKAADAEHIEGQVTQVDLEAPFGQWSDSIGTLVYDRIGRRRQMTWQTEKWAHFFLDDGVQRVRARTASGSIPGQGTEVTVTKSSPMPLMTFDLLFEGPRFAGGYDLLGLAFRAADKTPTPGSPDRLTCDTARTECLRSELILTVSCRAIGSGVPTTLWFDPASYVLRGWQSGKSRMLVDGAVPPMQGEITIDGSRVFKVLVTRRGADPALVSQPPKVEDYIKEVTGNGAVVVEL